MSLSRHLTPEELHALLGHQDSYSPQPNLSETAAASFGESGYGEDPVSLLKETVRVLSARVDLLENELSLMHSQLLSHVQVAMDEPVSLQSFRQPSPHPYAEPPSIPSPSVPDASSTRPSAVFGESMPIYPASPAASEESQPSLAPRSDKHRRKKGIMKLFD